MDCRLWGQMGERWTGWWRIGLRDEKWGVRGEGGGRRYEG